MPRTLEQRQIECRLTKWLPNCPAWLLPVFQRHAGAHDHIGTLQPQGWTGLCTILRDIVLTCLLPDKGDKIQTDPYQCLPNKGSPDMSHDRSRDFFSNISEYQYLVTTLFSRAGKPPPRYPGGTVPLAAFVMGTSTELWVPAVVPLVPIGKPPPKWLRLNPVG
ncbi:uncharacterized protein TRIVIDRAFT_67432 [Trichoderma virens Gv29-8]|uniref:Uncharacterized protein n=1 Tax=Hypocrea virens (strain Gv29-8 / FGSC 10586) TaxID=413071 RepID=G9N645_HYPVG|nr:uncharacterized protein TRIVIDRAFT_67432 [Trichoderma virens Gv29-8]EHK18235.1 hypothetical protein TRIVIDRAFT_67432 [Trichoderma virens Gv29-8]UKZ53894.1 hypothetical protein TrVGV298_007696 [Trichoderma virens]